MMSVQFSNTSFHTLVLCAVLFPCAVMAQLRPSFSTAPLHSITDIKQLKADKWNIVIESGEHAEINRIDPEIEKVQEEKTKIKLQQLGGNMKWNGADAEKFRYDTPEVKNNFTGLVTGAIPSDNGTSVSNGKYVIHSINSSITIKDTSGTVYTTTSLSAFLGVSKTISDPRVIYDSYSDRFIVLAIPVDQCMIYISFSASNDPTGTWHNYAKAIPGETLANYIYDYPYAGVNEHDLVISGSVFPPSGFSVHPNILQIAKQDGYDGKTLRVNNYKLPTTSNYSLCVVNHGKQHADFGNKSYLVTDIRSGGGGDALILYTITDTVGGSPQLLDTTIPVSHYAPAGNATQKGTSATLKTTDTRIMSAVYADGTIHMVHHADYSNSGYHGIVYYRLDAKTHAIQSYRFAKPQTDLCFPSVALFSKDSTDKTALVAFMESSSQTYPGLSAIICNDDGSWSAPITVKEGLGRILTTRWGDYSSTARVHNATTPSVWVSGEYGAAGSVRSSWIAQISAIATVVPDPVKPKVNVYHRLYPNPVWGELWKLEFYLPVEQFVNISIYDAVGQLVKKLYDGPLAAGETKLTFDKNALTAGIYVVRVSVPDRVLYTDKIIVR